ncbi:MAG: tetratricopeptide repeat protein, partial [Mucilaginibacter sp.]
MGEKYYEIAAKYYSDKHDAYNQSVTWRNLGDAICKIKANKTPAKTSQLNNPAEKYYLMARTVLKGEKDTEKCINALHDLARSYGIAGLPMQAKMLWKDVIAKYGHSRFNNLTAVYVLLSQQYRNEGNSDSSLFFILKCIKRVEKIKDTVNAHRAYGELALVYQELGQIENSIIWYKRTLQLRERIPNLPQEFLYRTAGFMAQGLIKQGKAEEALREIIALEKRKAPVDDKGKALIAQVKAYCYNGLKQYKLAEVYYLQMMQFLGKTDQGSYFIFAAKYDIGEFYVQQKKYDRAAVYLKGLDAVALNVSKRRDIQFLFFKIDSAKGSTLSALQHFQQFKLLNDSVFNATKSKQISELQIKYATDQKENDIKSLKKDGLLQFEKVKQANNARNLTLIGTALLLVVIGLLYSSYRVNKKQTREINLKNTSLNHLIVEKDSLLEEKEWLMKEIHH